MRPEAVRVVYQSRPYLVTRRDDGSLDRAYGPFTPGTEPSLAEVNQAAEVRDETVLAALEDLLPISPALPSRDDTLAGG
jgi:hypothetical protein